MSIRTKFKYGDLLILSINSMDDKTEPISICNILATALRDGADISAVRLDYSSISMKELRRLAAKHPIKWVRIGNRVDKSRQSVIVIHASGRIDIKRDIDSHSAFFDIEKNIAMLGELDGLEWNNYLLQDSGIACKNNYSIGFHRILNPETAFAGRKLLASEITDDIGISNKGNQTHWLPFAPFPAIEGDIWFNTSNQNMMNIFVSGNWMPYSDVRSGIGTYIDGFGIYTGALTAQQVNAVDINASSIKSGVLEGVTYRSRPPLDTWGYVEIVNDQIKMTFGGGIYPSIFLSPHRMTFPKTQNVLRLPNGFYLEGDLFAFGDIYQGWNKISDIYAQKSAVSNLNVITSIDFVNQKIKKTNISINNNSQIIFGQESNWI